MNDFDLDGVIDTTSVTATDLIAAGLIMLATLIVAAVVGHVTRQRLSRPETDTLQVARFAGTGVRWIVTFVGGAWAISFLGADVAWLTITIVLVLIVVAFAARPMLEKYAAGVALATATGFGIGDDIRVNGFDGRVIEITGRSTVLRLLDGRRVHLPNTDMTGHDIVVFTVDRQRRTEIELEVDRRHTFESVKRVILEALGAVGAIASDPAPRVRARGFGIASVTLSVRIWHESDLESGIDALDESVQAIARALDAAGMGLAHRQLEVLLRNRA